VVVNVTAADASSFRASQGQIAADMARAIEVSQSCSLYASRLSTGQAWPQASTDTLGFGLAGK
jgi:hypothetical protein